jgi:DNA ligase 1
MTATKTKAKAKIVKLPVLYSRRSDGKVQTWMKEIEGNMHRSTSGIMNGELVVAKWTVCVPKYVGKSNEVTAEEQAFREAQAEWQKKKDKGYKETLDLVDEVGFFEPMLAKKWQDYSDGYRYPVMIQPKLDGLRLIARKEGLFSRNGKPYRSIPHIAEVLEPVFKRYPKAIFDGEVYADKFAHDFEKICSLARQQKPTPEDLAAARASIQYHVYDLPYLVEPGKTDPGINNYHRQEALQQVHDQWFAYRDSPVKLVETRLVHDEAEVTRWYERFLEQGYEGLMVRDPEATYANKRTDRLLKYKEFSDGEYRILFVVPGIGNRTGVAGAFICEDVAQTISFKSNIKGNMAFCKEILEHQDRYVGKMATIQYFNLTAAGIPRFPYFLRLRTEE